jgi:hypothetical protein
VLITPLLAAALAALFVIALLRSRRPRAGGRPRRRGPGAGAAGAVYELLNEDRRRALEIIVEERAEATDPEHRDGNLPDLEYPTGRGKASPRDPSSRATSSRGPL